MLFSKSIFLFTLVFVGLHEGEALYDQDSPVMQLDASNYKQIFDTEHLWIVEFFAPWCGHCKKLAPSYEEAARELTGYSVRVAAIDCDANADVCRAYGVTGYPTIKTFMGPIQHNPYSNNKLRAPQDYTGPTNGASIVKWARNKLPSRVQVLKGEGAVAGFDTLKSAAFDDGFNLAVVFSTKHRASTPLKALSLDFANRLPITLLQHTEEKGEEGEEGQPGTARVLGEAGLTADSLPALVVMSKSGETHVYEGDLRSRDAMADFLRQYAKTEAEAQAGKAGAKGGEEEGVAKLSVSQFNTQVLGGENAWVVAFVQGGGEDQLPENWSSMSKELQGLGVIRTALVDCTGRKEGPKLCSPELLDPARPLRVFPYGEGKVKGKVATAEGAASGSMAFGLDSKGVTGAKKAVVGGLPNRVTSVLPSVPNAMDGVMMEAAQHDKIGVLLLSEDQPDSPPDMLKGLQLAFGGSVVTALVPNPDEEMLKRFQVTELPTLVALYNVPFAGGAENEVRFQMTPYVEQLHGEMSFGNVAGFLHTVLQLKTPGASLVSASGASAGFGGVEDEAEVELVELGAQGWEARCLGGGGGKTAKGLCAIAVLAPEGADAEEDDALSAQLDLLSSVAAANRKGGASPFTFGWLDGRCHAAELEARFGLQPHSLPTLLVYSPSKGRYATFVGSFAQQDLSSFLRGVVSGRVATVPIYSQGGDDAATVSFSREAGECVEERKSIQAIAVGPDGSVEEDDDMAAMMAEILAEEEARKKEMEEALAAEATEAKRLAEEAKQQKLRDLAKEKAKKSKKGKKKGKKGKGKKKKSDDE